MAEEARPSQPLNARTARGRRARHWRTFVLPVAVIAAIAVAIWWLEYRPGTEEAALSPISGEEYGPAELPASLLPPGTDPGVGEGEPAPEFLLPRLDGGDLRLSDYRGQPVVLNFWATWCAPCRKEIPQLVAAHEQFAEQGLAVVAVNLQEGGSIVQRFADDFGMDFPIAIDTSGAVADDYRLLGLPTTYFIDREGVIRSVFFGPFVREEQGTSVQEAIEGSELLKRIQEVLE